MLVVLVVMIAMLIAFLASQGAAKPRKTCSIGWVELIDTNQSRPLGVEIIPLLHPKRWTGALGTIESRAGGARVRTYRREMRRDHKRIS